MYTTILEEACARKMQVPRPNGHYMVQVVPATREMQPVLELRCLVDHLLDHLCRLVPDELPVQEVPEKGVR